MRHVRSLVDTFVRARGGEAPAHPGGLERWLLALYQRGRDAYQEVALGASDFAEHLGRCGVPVDDDQREAVHAEDLYLCCAALRGDAAAIAQLRRANRPVLAVYLRDIDASKAFLDEVEQGLWDKVLVGTLEAGPALATYAGRGPLANWLGVSAQRIALMQRRSEAARERAADRLGAEAELLASDPE